MIGVPVSLTAKDSSGKVIDIGTATTNAYYGTFSKSWTPPKEDTYTITASFTSDASYGSSSAATSLIVGPTTASSATQPEVVVPDYTMLILGGIIAVIIVVVIVGVLLYRKKP
jgi:hypothetical protein